MRRLPLRSPPRMRGKVIVRSRNAVQIGITPAYAGKSARILKRRTEKRDHPRVCGEKRKDFETANRKKGSPPRVRGKAEVRHERDQEPGITPACAGKRHCPRFRPGKTRDHPRVCGEKESCQKIQKTTLGSPPRMRGTDLCDVICGQQSGITPAYAGKRYPYQYAEYCIGDHPRVCGEKPLRPERKPKA